MKQLLVVFFGLALMIGACEGNGRSRNLYRRRIAATKRFARHF